MTSAEDIMTPASRGSIVEAGPDRNPVAVGDTPVGEARHVEVKHDAVSVSTRTIEDKPLWKIPRSDQDDTVPRDLSGNFVGLFDCRDQAP